MRGKITLSITLVLITGIAFLTVSDSAHADRMNRVADSGIITLGPNQILRVSVCPGDYNSEDITIMFRQMRYIEQGNVYRIAAQTVSNPITLAPNEAAVVDGADFAAWRTVVLASRPNVKVTGIVFDTSTMRVVSYMEMEIVAF